MKPGAGAFLAALCLLAGCGMGATTFVHPDYNFAFVERVAVIPFENLSDDRGAGARMSRYFVSELLKAEVFDVVEPGEVTEKMVAVGSLRVAELAPDAIVELGASLRAQALFLGSVTESASVRSGSTTENVVTLDLRLVETETGVVIWSTTLTETGRGFWSGLFGTNGNTMGEVSRKVSAWALQELVD
ncbi:hypothetical protein DRQ53_12310 [bacterium]|nr:MAG: hypothetical protein DRQ53_12310 [bacterium]